MKKLITLFFLFTSISCFAGETHATFILVNETHLDPELGVMVPNKDQANETFHAESVVFEFYPSGTLNLTINGKYKKKNYLNYRSGTFRIGISYLGNDAARTQLLILKNLLETSDGDYSFAIDLNDEDVHDQYLEISNFINIYSLEGISLISNETGEVIALNQFIDDSIEEATKEAKRKKRKEVFESIKNKIQTFFGSFNKE